MPTGLDQLQHIVVLMMENRSFDHMLGSLPGIGGIDDAGAYTNPDTTGAAVKPQALAQFQAQLQRIRIIIFRQSTCKFLAAAPIRIAWLTCRDS